MKKIIFSVSILCLIVACMDVNKGENDSHQVETTVDTSAVKTVTSSTSTEDTTSIPDAIKSFILPNYEVLRFEKGDLNNNKKEDIVLILKVENEVDNQDALRPLLLLLQNVNNTYTLAARNDSIVDCRGCGGKFDPLAGIVIKNGYFTIEHEGGSRDMWTKNITFHFDSKQNLWFLLRIDESSIDTIDENSERQYKSKTNKDFGRINFINYSFERMNYQN